ncbi:hypothetical protein RJ55_03415 [Drechmeria coniospora]|nr:hypothetical protein RJ55_03415 [Drechmeria coniospora]
MSIILTRSPRPLAPPVAPPETVPAAISTQNEGILASQRRAGGSVAASLWLVLPGWCSLAGAPCPPELAASRRHARQLHADALVEGRDAPSGL